MASYAQRQPNGASNVYYDGAYAPFAESYAECYGNSNCTGQPDHNFTGQNQDIVGGQYDFMFRQYSPTQGRWLSPDPLGVGAVDTTDPQTWDRYAYVRSSALSSIDFLGLELCADGETADFCTQSADPLAGDGGFVISIPYLVSGGSGGGGGGSGTNCGNSRTGFGFGLLAGANADAGVGKAGTSIQGSIGLGVFANSGTGASAGAFASGGATAYAGQDASGKPQQGMPPTVAGVYRGYGPGVFITNAGSANQLAGPFQTFTFNIGILFAKASVSFSRGSNGVWSASITAGPEPFANGAGASITNYTTATASASTGGKCQ